ncbi:U3 small nucleolar RNA-associated protein 18 homolog [Xenia sp. Carnegie-2017]|uniref:U3 small nucleolar RNA-associated protein 18 homolog n=1 Tax=Xenia sp. Carnegie-2017 TaxID=2897299 RepID=UPI001F03A46A|nr:U3 small nucleolar RNA-associated protein 18 homolog [Xenia sp. Carnegie-2017]
MLRRKSKRQFDKCADEDPVNMCSISNKQSRLINQKVTHEELENLVFGGKQYLESLDEDDLQEDDFIEETELPAWVDEDDSNVWVDVSSKNRLKKFKEGEKEIISGDVLKKKLESHFQKIYGVPEWAKTTTKCNPNQDDDEGSEILQHAGNFLSKKSEYLPRGLIDIGKVKDANCSNKFDAVVKCLEFHPSSKILLVAGLNNKLSLFQVDGKTNICLQNIHVKGFPIHSAHFIGNSEQIILASQRKFFYYYDMNEGYVTRIPEIRGKDEKHFFNCFTSPDGKYLVFTGKSGYIYLLSSQTKQWIADLKMNGSVTTISFYADGTRMLSAGSDGEIYVWCLKTRKCLHKFKDEGCIRCTSLAVSPCGQYVACGSDSGVVNIYDQRCLEKAFPKPIKTVMNLTTKICQLKFNSTSEILGMSSKEIKNAFRLLHVPSLTVFSNWPNSKTPLRYVETFDFSPKSGYLVVGNDCGRALLFRLNHYADG